MGECLSWRAFESTQSAISGADEQLLDVSVASCKTKSCPQREGGYMRVGQGKVPWR